MIKFVEVTFQIFSSIQTFSPSLLSWLQIPITSNGISTGKKNVKLRCDERFTHAFTACGCVFKEITLVGSNQGNYFENATRWLAQTKVITLKTQLHAVNAC